MLPDSRRPRRFARARSPIAPTHRKTRLGISSGNTDVTAATPAAVETATVDM
jgi:hypothetical protein